MLVWKKWSKQKRADIFPADHFAKETFYYNDKQDVVIYQSQTEARNRDVIVHRTINLF